MDRSYVNALKLGFEGAYVIDYKNNSCHVIFSTCLHSQYEDSLMSIKFFKELCINSLDEGYKEDFIEFINETKLRNAFINDKQYSTVYAARLSEDSYALYRLTMIPETAERGLICSSQINENDVIDKDSIINIEKFNVIFIRLNNDAHGTIAYANNRLYQKLGYTRREMKELFGNSLLAVALDDLLKLVESSLYCRDDSYCEFKIKFKHKDGHTIWVSCVCTFEKDDDVFTLVMTDISEQIKKEHEERVQNEMHNVILKNLNLIFFTYDIAQDRVVVDISTESGESRQVIYNDFLKKIDEVETIYLEHRSELGAVVTKIIERGYGKETFEYMSSIGGNGFKWVRVNMIGVTNEEGELYRIIGRMDNIEKEMHHRNEESRWMKIAKNDSLTALLTRDTGVEYIKRTIEGREVSGGALFILDIDDFKEINDASGHLEGDRVLSEVARVFSEQFRSEDFVCRYGGDEMLAYVSGIDDSNVIKRKADYLLKSIREIKLQNGKHVTCSVGISIKNRGDNVSYKTMFGNADRALYLAKNKDKDCSWIFNHE